MDGIKLCARLIWGCAWLILGCTSPSPSENSAPHSNPTNLDMATDPLPDLTDFPYPGYDILVPIRDVATGLTGYWKAKGYQSVRPSRWSGHNFPEITRQKEMAISPQFEVAYPFREGVALVRQGNYWGAIDPRGDFRIAPKFAQLGGDDFRGFSEGTVPAFDGQQWGFIDTSGQWTIPPRFAQALGFSEGIARVQEVDRTGWSTINQKGELIARTNCEIIGPYREGLAPALSPKDGWHYLNPQGKKQLPRKGTLFSRSRGYESAMAFSQGWGLIQTAPQKYQFINPQGQMLPEGPFSLAHSFSQGRASVQKNGQWRYLDQRGNPTDGHLYTYASSYFRLRGQTMARVQKSDGQSEFIDLNGDPVNLNELLP